MLIRINGLETYYTLEGEGAPVLLLHGWGVSNESFASLAPVLAERFQVLRVDLPGFGWSEGPPVAWGSAEYRDHVAALLDGLSIGRAAVLGHSFGGRIAIRLAAEQPARVARLVLVASAGLRAPRRWRYYVRVGTTKLLKGLCRVPGCGGFCRRALERWAGRVGSRDYRKAGAMRPTLVRLVNEDLAPLLPAVEVPTLILWGDQDREVGQAAMETLTARIRNARLVVFPGAGHFPFLDAPAEFLNALLPFLAEGGRP
ncbi:MAG: alpha/beta hydrolase [candidate division NC10 bacterium]|nr:alpha/beta hydrolase [candidate division NC10 bacterium]